jgi:outer membrane receptor protein involved in Fe transport
MGPAAFGPEKIVNYEAGVKQSWLQDRLSLAFDVFYIDWKDIQLSTQAVSDGTTYSVQNNGGTAASKGVEFSSALAPLRGLTVSATAAYVDAYLTQDAPEVGGVNGERLPRIPRVNAALGSEYGWNVAGARRAFVGANWRYVGNSFSDYSNVASRMLLPSYNVLDLRAGLRWSSLWVILFVKNINNSGGITALGALNLTPPGYYYASVIQPRTFGINVTARYP